MDMPTSKLTYNIHISIWKAVVFCCACTKKETLEQVAKFPQKGQIELPLPMQVSSQNPVLCLYTVVENLHVHSVLHLLEARYNILLSALKVNSSRDASRIVL